MQIELSALLAGAVPIIGAIVWLVRLEGRINLGDQKHSDIIGRLARIETKLDRANSQ